MSEYDKGYSFGFDGCSIPWWLYRYYTDDFINGYLIGRADLEQLVIRAAESR